VLVKGSDPEDPGPNAVSQQNTTVAVLLLSGRTGGQGPLV